MRYTKVASTAFQQLQLNAGILLTDFDPATATYADADMFASTSGGVAFASNPTYIDYGEDIDNVPANTMQMKRIDYYEPRISGTAKTLNDDTVQRLMGASTKTVEGGVSKFEPSATLALTDFKDLWWVGDYSDKNGNTKGGYVAICLHNALNTGGFSVQSNDNGKGDFEFDFLGHYDLEDMDTVPFDVYVRVGEEE